MDRINDDGLGKVYERLGHAAGDVYQWERAHGKNPEEAIDELLRVLGGELRALVARGELT